MSGPGDAGDPASIDPEAAAREIYAAEVARLDALHGAPRTSWRRFRRRRRLRTLRRRLRNHTFARW